MAWWSGGLLPGASSPVLGGNGHWRTVEGGGGDETSSPGRNAAMASVGAMGVDDEDDAGR
jgi:hypothetical protein